MSRSVSVPILLLFIAAFTAVGFSSSEIASLEVPEKNSETQEALYLPNGESLKALSLGYSNSFAHILWFNTINYFGKHYAGDRNYRWLAHMCDLVTTLTPKATQAVLFCGTMLAWEAQQPEKSVAILTRAIENNPTDWRLPYQRGMMELLFLKDSTSAQSDFLMAAKLPNAHPTVKRLAAKTLAEHQDKNTALEFLDRLIEDENDQNVRRVLISKRDEIALGDR